MAPTLVHVDGFEFQVISTSFFGSTASPRTYDTVTGNVTPDTTTVHSGGASMKCDPTATVAAEIRRNTAAGQRAFVASVYVNFSVLPTGSTALLILQGVTGVGNMSVRFNPVTNKFGLYNSATSLGDLVMEPVVTGRWYLLDFKMDASANPNAASARVDGKAASEVSSTAVLAASDFLTARLSSASTTGPAATYYLDDWIYGHTLADYPLGHHAVELLKPTSDGTHVTTGSNVEDQASTVIAPGTYTTAYSLVDEVPPEDATDYIKQVAIASGDYAEVVFATPTGTPWGATYWAAISGAAAGASDMLFRVVNSGGSTLLDIGGVGSVSGTTKRYSCNYVAGDPTGNKGRMGFASTDVSPVPRAMTFVAQAVRPTGVENVDGLGIPIR